MRDAAKQALLPILNPTIASLTQFQHVIWAVACNSAVKAPRGHVMTESLTVVSRVAKPPHRFVIESSSADFTQLPKAGISGKFSVSKAFGAKKLLPSQSPQRFGC